MNRYFLSVLLWYCSAQQLVASSQNLIPLLLWQGGESFIGSDYEFRWEGRGRVRPFYSARRLWVPSASHLTRVLQISFGEGCSARRHAGRTLPEECYTENTDFSGEGTCVVCLELLQGIMPIITLNRCGHQFHVNCCGWYQDRDTCPLCRTKVTE
jgi:hypothetical protein